MGRANFGPHHPVAPILTLDHVARLQRHREARPAAAAVVLLRRGEQRLARHHIDVDACLLVVPELVVERRLGGALLGDRALRRRQLRQRSLVLTVSIRHDNSFTPPWGPALAAGETLRHLRAFPRPNKQPRPHITPAYREERAVATVGVTAQRRKGSRPPGPAGNCPPTRGRPPGCRSNPGAPQDGPHGAGPILSLCPRRHSSPWMRRYPQVGFSLASRSPSARTFAATGGRPPGVAAPRPRGAPTEQLRVLCRRAPRQQHKPPSSWQHSRYSSRRVMCRSSRPGNASGELPAQHHDRLSGTHRSGQQHRVGRARRVRKLWHGV
jgi:hypothetical protein